MLRKSLNSRSLKRSDADGASGPQTGWQRIKEAEPEML